MQLQLLADHILPADKDNFDAKVLRSEYSSAHFRFRKMVPAHRIDGDRQTGRRGIT